MRRLKTDAWCPPPVSKNDLGVVTPLVAAERKESASSFCPGASFLRACVAPLPVRDLREFLHILIIIFNSIKIFKNLFIPYKLRLFQKCYLKNVFINHILSIYIAFWLVNVCNIK